MFYVYFVFILQLYFMKTLFFVLSFIELKFIELIIILFQSRITYSAIDQLPQCILLYSSNVSIAIFKVCRAVLQLWMNLLLCHLKVYLGYDKCIDMAYYDYAY